VNQNAQPTTLYTSFTMILPVFNEEARIGRVLEYYRKFARIVVVDNASKDRTVELVRDAGIEIVTYVNPGTSQTPECLKYYLTLVRTDYVLFLSCSEYIPPRLMTIFDEVAAKKSHDVVSCVRDSYTSGELIQLWGGRFRWLEARVERFVNRNGINPDKLEIHGSFELRDSARVLRLPRAEGQVIAHLRDVDARSLIMKSMDYAFVEASHRAERGKPITLCTLILLFAKEKLRFLHLPVSQWNRIALREVWARMVMHTITYWAGWELRSGKSVAYSRERSEQLWRSFVCGQADAGDRESKSDA
jgi:glycosyltransferase involved in cell wall biosynthesis